MAKRLSLREQIVAAAKAYHKATGCGMCRLSTDIVGSGMKLNQISKGADLHTATWERAMQWLSDHWPAGVDWPANVIRLEPTKRRGRKPASETQAAV